MVSTPKPKLVYCSRYMVMKLEIRDCVSGNPLRRYLYLGPNRVGWVMGLMLLCLLSGQRSGSHTFGQHKTKGLLDLQ